MQSVMIFVLVDYESSNSTIIVYYAIGQENFLPISTNQNSECHELQNMLPEVIQTSNQRVDREVYSG